jgi:hypothetical protein
VVNLIKLTVDYPASQDDFVPFLNIEVKIESGGQFNSRLFRKPQRKPLTLHYNSHHTSRIKIATAESMYNTAETLSSNNDKKEYSRPCGHVK